jgi:hypothetical protein
MPHDQTPKAAVCRVSEFSDFNLKLFYLSCMLHDQTPEAAECIVSEFSDFNFSSSRACLMTKHQKPLGAEFSDFDLNLFHLSCMLHDQAPEATVCRVFLVDLQFLSFARMAIKHEADGSQDGLPDLIYANCSLPSCSSSVCLAEQSLSPVGKGLLICLQKCRGVYMKCVSTKSENSENFA